ncbi:MAG: acyltransferase family protein, partial [Parahaliea sp.]
MQYRADIDGLRAVAVLSVVIFHLGLAQFAGGYVGVDVFFVISGYLITTLITARLAKGDFSLADFYGRRIRRLFPALKATVALTFVAAACILFPQDFLSFSRSAVASLFSLSNIVFYSEAGYWDTASELKPLLHTWSLGVEEQFYLLWPALLLLVLGRGNGQRLWKLAALLTVVGLGLCVWWSWRDISAAFYLLPFRVFEFALGALVIPLSRSPAYRRLAAAAVVRDLLLLAGLALILWSVFRFDASTAFPGWAVIVPTLGGALVLLAGSVAGPGLLGRALLANPLCRWLDKVSYAMYLVHWPVVALYRYYRTETVLDGVDALLLAALTLVLTVLLHYLVEQRFYQRAGERQGRLPRFEVSAPRILAASVLFALVPLSAWQGDGWSWRQPDLLLSASAITRGMDDRYQLIRPACTPARWQQGGSQCHRERPLQVLVFGDSHEPDAFNFLYAAYGDDPAVNLMHFGSTNNCPDLRGADGAYRSSDAACNQRFAALFEGDLPAQLDVLVYAGARPFAQGREVHLQVLRDLKARNPGLKILTVGGYIGTRLPCWMLMNRAASSRACTRQDNIGYFERHPQWSPLYRDFMAITDLFVDRIDLLCAQRKLENCMTQTP